MFKKFLKSFYKNIGDILFGLVIVALICWIYLTSVGPVERVVNEINNTFYDQMLRATLDKLPPIKQNNIAIIAIDDKSIAEQGRWPWSRKKMAELLMNLKQLEAGVIAFDIIFSESERNAITETIHHIKEIPVENRPTLQPDFEKLTPYFDFDSKFAEALSQNEDVLGFVLTQGNNEPIGQLPAPLLTLSDQEINATYIPVMDGSLANLPNLQQAAKNGGFLNSDPDEDGTLRYTNLLLIYKNGVYGSLALEATRDFLLTEKIQLVQSAYGSSTILEGIQMDQFVIPTDERGRILIPFRGGPYTFPFYSATDILQHRVPPEAIAGKLLFVGATATGLGEIQPTAVSSSYPGVEIHATVAAAILDQYFPSRPVWGRGLEFVLILGLGIIAAILFPFLNAFWLAGISSCAIIAWFGTTTYLWIHKGVLLTLIFPLATVLLLAFINIVHSYLISSRQRKEIKSVFGQYVPQQHIDTILKSPTDSLMSGDSRELSVLFSDIRGFTTMSEKMTAVELKAQLNEYLTAMTGEIFKLGGTIDKYVGDMIMAFWNAPLPDELHAQKAILAGLNMQKELKEVNQIFAQKGLPSIGIGVGINTGIINVGDMGSKYRRAYTAIGDSVNLASRLEGMCRQYEVDLLVGEDTYKAAQHDFIFMHVDKVKVKGKLQGVDIYLPLGLPQEVSEEKRQQIAIYHQALDYYFSRDWSKAEELMFQLTKAYPDLQLYGIYLNRIRDYAANPPGEDWDGAYVSHTK